MRYAEDTQSELWEFAVRIQHLQKLNLSRNDLRWLIKKGLVDSAREVKQRDGGEREFQELKTISFGKHTCFVLTDSGVLFAESIHGKDVRVQQVKYESNGQSQVHPHWNAELRELSIQGRLVKRFKWQAVNQEIVLGVFQEDGWPTVIDDPLPPKGDQDPKSRLHDTIKALNRNQEYAVIRFHGNGTGEGIRWELTNEDSC